LLDLKTGGFKQIAERGAFRSDVAAVSPDDKTLYFGSREPSTKKGWDHITAINLLTLQATPVFKFPEAVEVGRLAIALSPNGRTLAIIHGVNQLNRLALVNVDGSDYREIYSFSASNANDKLAWTKDGRAVVFATSGGQRGDWQIMRIGVAGGNPEFTGLTVKALGTFDLSPDGTRIAFSTTRGGNPTEELLVLENLPVFLKDSK
jgi:Tol biopolymer transport system component